jgi:hypothetical protein
MLQQMCIFLHVKYPVFLSVLIKLRCSRQVFEKYSNFMKILPEGAELLLVDRWTVMTKLTVAFRNSTNAPKSVNMGAIGKEAGDRNGLTRAPLSFTRKIEGVPLEAKVKGASQSSTTE